MDETIVVIEDRRVFHRRLRIHPEKQNVARRSDVGIYFDQMSSRCIAQRFCTSTFRPIRSVGRRLFRLCAVERTPDTPHEAQTVAARALCAGLMHIRCADPRARFLQDRVT